jgi:chromosome partitioning protein
VNVKRLVFALEKGGTAKTTSAVHVAHALARAGRQVLLVDADAQDQCAAHLGLGQFRPGLADILFGRESPRECIVPARERLYLLPAGPDLPKAKSALPSIAAAAGVSTREAFARALSFAESGRIDVVVVDTAPGTDELLLSVLLYADEIVVPLPPEMMAVRGLAKFRNTLADIGRRVDRLLPTVHDRRVGKTARIMAKLEQHFNGRMLGEISYTTRISEAAGAGRTIFEYAPKHRAAGEYETAAKSLLNGGGN